MYAVQTLLSKIQASKSIDFGDLFNESLGVFKKVWVQGLLLQLFSGPHYAPFYNRSLYYRISHLHLMVDSNQVTLRLHAVEPGSYRRVWGYL